MNCFSPSRQRTRASCRPAGAKNSRVSRSHGSAGSIENRSEPNRQLSEIENFRAVMFISKNPEQTIDAGRAYGEQARPGEVFALSGDLGAGKTQFVKGFVAGLGSTIEVTSTTFVLVHEYGE